MVGLHHLPRRLCLASIDGRDWLSRIIVPMIWPSWLSKHADVHRSRPRKRRRVLVRRRQIASCCNEPFPNYTAAGAGTCQRTSPVLQRNALILASLRP